MIYYIRKDKKERKDKLRRIISVMAIFPLESFSENLLPEYPLYHITLNGELYHNYGMERSIWISKKSITTKSGGIVYKLSPENEKRQKRISAAALILIAYKGGFDEEKQVLFHDSNPLNLSVENIYQSEEKDRYLIKHDLNKYHENLSDIFFGYSVCEDGTVYTRWNKGARKLENYWMEVKSRMVNGYITYGLLKTNGRQISAALHILLAHAFIGKRPSGLFVCHNDGNKLNNHLSNLRYDTPKSNTQDRLVHGTMLFGEECPNSRLKESQIIDIFRYKKDGLTHKEMAAILKISKHNVYLILKRKIWGHIQIPPELL